MRAKGLVCFGLFWVNVSEIFQSEKWIYLDYHHVVNFSDVHLYHDFANVICLYLDIFYRFAEA
jgi:hypothetical protein